MSCLVACNSRTNVDRQTDTQRDWHTDLLYAVTLAAHARRGLITTHSQRWHMSSIKLDSCAWHYPKMESFIQATEAEYSFKYLFRLSGKLSSQLLSNRKNQLASITISWMYTKVTLLRTTVCAHTCTCMYKYLLDVSMHTYSQCSISCKRVNCISYENQGLCPIQVYTLHRHTTILSIFLGIHWTLAYLYMTLYK